MKKDKRGLLKIILIVLLVFIIIIAGVIFYLHNFYSFKTIIICVTNNVSDTKKTCQTQQDCMNFLYEKQPDLKSKIENSPNFAREAIQQVFSKALFCEGTCKMKQVRGIDNPNGDMGVDSCVSGEEEIKIEIKGKEALEFLKSGQAKLQ